MKNKQRDGSLNKAARLIILMELEDRGKLADLSLQNIADKYFPDVVRSTIMRDLRDVERLRKTLATMRKKIC